MTEPPGPRRPAARHGRGGAQPQRLLRAGVAPLPAAPAHRLDLGHRARRTPGLRHEPPRRRRPQHGDNDDLWPTLLLGNDEVSIGVQRYVRGRPEFLRDSDGDELFFVHARHGLAPHRVRPARPTGSATTWSCPAAPPTGSSRPSPPCCSRSRRTGRASRCPSGACSAATPCSTRRSSRCPRPRRSTRPATSPSWSSGTATAPVVRYPFHPCDVVGWKGDVAPMRLNVDDIRPVTSPRYHLPPSAHTTWVADGFVVCTFAPRPMEEDPEALRLPVLPPQRRLRRGDLLPPRRVLLAGRHRRGDDDVPPVRPAPRAPARRSGPGRRAAAAAANGGERRWARGGWPTSTR